MNANPDIHAAHPYPCKFPSEAIRPFVESGGGTILDPFCGSGTTVLDAATHGWSRVYGYDSNPIAILISRYKTLWTDEAFFAAANTALAEFALGIDLPEAHALEFNGATHWFAKHVLRDLARIVAWIDRQREARLRTWLRLSVSRIVNRVSRQDSETRYVAVDRHIGKGETFERFAESAAYTLSLLAARPPIGADVTLEQSDISTGIPLPARSVDRIVTSPPYANTMDYYLYHKQRMNVLGYDFKATQNMEIGSRHEYSSLRAPAAKWEDDYRQALLEFRRVLRPGGDAIVIIGDSQIAGKKIDAAELTASITSEVGFAMEVVESVALDGRSRSFSRGFQRPNKYEHVIRLIAMSLAERSNEAVLVLPAN